MIEVRLFMKIRYEDNQAVGNIVAVDNDHIMVTTQGGMSNYHIPKSLTKAFLPNFLKRDISFV
jgi:hypothetical protein